MLWCCRPAAPKGKQKWAAAPEGALRAPAYRHPAGASPLCKRWAQAKHRQHPRPRGQAQDRPAATLSQTNFSTECGKICLRPRASPGGGDPQEGVKPPSCPPAPRRRTVPRAPQHAKSPAREVRAHSLPVRHPAKSCGRAMRAPTVRGVAAIAPGRLPLRVWLPRITCSYGGVCPASTTHAKKPFACPASVTAHANPAQNARSAVRYWYSLSSGSISR